MLTSSSTTKTTKATRAKLRTREREQGSTDTACKCDCSQIWRRKYLKLKRYIEKNQHLNMRYVTRYHSLHRDTDAPTNTFTAFNNNINNNNNNIINIKSYHQQNMNITSHMCDSNEYDPSVLSIDPINNNNNSNNNNDNTNDENDNDNDGITNGCCDYDRLFEEDMLIFDQPNQSSTEHHQYTTINQSDIATSNADIMINNTDQHLINNDIDVVSSQYPNKRQRNETESEMSNNKIQHIYPSSTTEMKMITNNIIIRYVKKIETKDRQPLIVPNNSNNNNNIKYVKSLHQESNI